MEGWYGATRVDDDIYGERSEQGDSDSSDSPTTYSLSSTNNENGIISFIGNAILIIVVVLVIVFPVYVLWQIGGFFYHHNIHADVDWYGRYVVPYNIISFTDCTGEHNKVEYGFSLDYPNEFKIVSWVNESWHITDEQDKQIQTLLNRGRIAYLRV